MGVGYTRGMYVRTAGFYDAIYAWKDYPGEVERLLAMLQSRGVGAGTWLDVACGTGKHLALLPNTFEREGLELDPGMAEIARQRLPDVPIHVADMRDFRLDRTFDVVTCLFSAIGHMTDLPDLHQAIRTMAQHVKPGGTLVVEPWFFPHQFVDGFVGGDFYDQPELKIARVARNWTEGPISVCEIHHLVGTPGHVESFVETLRLGLFTDHEYQTAFQAAGLTVEHDPEGLMGRGLYLATMPG